MTIPFSEDHLSFRLRANFLLHIFQHCRKSSCVTNGLSAENTRKQFFSYCQPKFYGQNDRNRNMSRIVIRECKEISNLHLNTCISVGENHYIPPFTTCFLIPEIRFWLLPHFNCYSRQPTTPNLETQSRNQHHVSFSCNALMKQPQIAATKSASSRRTQLVSG